MKDKEYLCFMAFKHCFRSPLEMRQPCGHGTALFGELLISSEIFQKEAGKIQCRFAENH